MRPILVINPRTDAGFVAFARESLDGQEVVDPAALEHQLRERYPDATVNVRSLSGEPTTVWYLYRDGHWTRPG